MSANSVDPAEMSQNTTSQLRQHYFLIFHFRDAKHNGSDS